jgi:hypothetical protein
MPSYSGKKMERAALPETSVNFYQTARRHIPEDCNYNVNLLTAPNVTH